MHKLRTMHLFAGAGGGLLADMLLGHRPVCAVEINGYCQQVLSARQKDGALPWFPIFDDVTKFEGDPWRGLVDIVSGGFPCQDISAAGNGAGIDGARSGLWGEMARIIGEVRPRFVFVENSPLLVGRGLAVVLGDLAEMGYDAEWCIVSASDVDAPHQRERIWIMANDNRVRELQSTRHKQDFGMGIGERGESLADSDEIGRNWRAGTPGAEGRTESANRRQWPVEPGMGRVANGVANRVDRIKALGNGQVPRVAATAFDILSK